ncbi:hypothetical protein JOC77_000203 [Peribacillus deserti]|uniref:Uncharacterized protein n=1 Tax=Peribacillus deserti TaxID=673318 RepID=A0ABS2QCB6_9BACI|nr:hypothetical protein [Peribacillus deserti]MBM7690800.1 hypothetical protein [Peribacillus deserti]
MKWLFAVSFVLLFILSGCGDRSVDGMDEKEIKRVASQVAIDFLKREEKVDFVVEEVNFTSSKELTNVFVEGYEKGDKKNKMTVMIDYVNDFEVEGVGSDK